MIAIWVGIGIQSGSILRQPCRDVPVLGRFHDLSPTVTLWEIDRGIGPSSFILGIGVNDDPKPYDRATATTLNPTQPK